MKKETLKLGGGAVEAYMLDNLIYFKVFNSFDDEIAIEITRYLDKMFEEMPDDLIRVWDVSNIPAESYKLTSECVHEISKWYKKRKVRESASKAYFIASEPLIFGVSRMYAIQSIEDDLEIEVLKNIDGLPEEIREKIPV